MCHLLFNRLRICPNVVLTNIHPLFHKFYILPVLLTISNNQVTLNWLNIFFYSPLSGVSCWESSLDWNSRQLWGLGINLGSNPNSFWLQFSSSPSSNIYILFEMVCWCSSVENKGKKKILFLLPINSIIPSLRSDIIRAALQYSWKHTVLREMVTFAKWFLIIHK